MKRRQWTQHALALLALQACSTPLPEQRKGPMPLIKPASMPFTLGVACGSVTAESLILWTRVLPAEFDAQKLPEADLMVRWELAGDAQFKHIVQKGEARASVPKGHSVHIKVQGLQPAQTYYYRFHCGDYSSAVGRASTAPPAGARSTSLRLAFASCQHWEFGYFGAYRDMALQAPDLVLFLGDYIYEGGPYNGPGQRVRRHNSPAVKTLAQYRARYALYKSDPDLQAAHAASPWINIWDDHEVENDYAGLLARDRDADFEARRLAAYRAWAEHMPVDFERMFGSGQTPDTRIYGHLDWGQLARIHLLDTRQYRDVHACVAPGRAGAFADAACPARHDPGRSLLGHAQEQWLQQSLAGSQAGWNIVAQQTLVTSLSPDPALHPDEKLWMDGWDGYAPAKARLLQALAQPGVRNPVVLGGDVHSEWVCDLRLDPSRPGSPKIATEACGTSITSSSGITRKMAERARSENPDIRYANTDKRGYNLLEITPAQSRLVLRACDDVRQSPTPVQPVAQFMIQDGKPGIDLAVF